MDYLDRESFIRTMASYSEALDKLFAICPKIRTGGSAGWGGEPFTRCHIEPAWGADDKLTRHITNVSIGGESLFDYGQPKQITKSNSVYRYKDLFKTFCSISVPYEVWGMNYAQQGHAEYVDDEGVRNEATPDVPAQPAKRETAALKLQFNGPGASLGNWSKDKAHIEQWASGLPTQESRYVVLKALADKQAEIDRWKAAIKAQAEMADVG